MKTSALALAFLAMTSSVFASTVSVSFAPVSTPAISTLAISAPAVSGPTAATRSRTPNYYVMMKHGRLIEVSHGKRNSVKKDITLTNETTIHPNGAIDAGSGQNLRLREGQYITMDGKIRRLKDMPHSAAGH